MQNFPWGGCPHTPLLLRVSRTRTLVIILIALPESWWLWPCYYPINGRPTLHELPTALLIHTSCIIVSYITSIKQVMLQDYWEEQFLSQKKDVGMGLLPSLHLVSVVFGMAIPTSLYISLKMFCLHPFFCTRVPLKSIVLATEASFRVQQNKSMVITAIAKVGREGLEHHHF